MPLFSTLLASVLMAPPKEALRTYRDAQLGISFNYPRNWGLRKERYMTVLTWRSSGGRDVKAQWVPTAFRDSAELWQRLQVDVAANRGDRIEKQWEEELLGVPLLLTRVTREEKGVTRSVWAGLIYSRTVNKLNFRVYSAPEDAAEAEASWRKVLLSVRTVTGDTPEAEAPGTKIVPPKEKVVDEPTVTWSSTSGSVKPRPVRAPKRQKLEKQPFFAYTPDAWEAKSDAIGVMGLKGTLILEAKKVGEGTGQKVWMNASSAQLVSMESVTTRKEKELGINRAGYTVWEVVRAGVCSGKPATLAVWGGQLDDNIWLLKYQGLPEEFRSDRSLIEGLVQSLSVESTGT